MRGVEAEKVDEATELLHLQRDFYKETSLVPYEYRQHASKQVSAAI